jgi:hypothetical protein
MVLCRQTGVNLKGPNVPSIPLQHHRQLNSATRAVLLNTFLKDFL